MPWRVYLDVSCLGRPLDDQSQKRVRLKARAIRMIFDLTDQGAVTRVASEFARMEILATTDETKREKMLAFLPEETHMMAASELDLQRFGFIRGLGFKSFDALHVTCAEALSADVFLSCDDRLCRRARKQLLFLRTRVANPVDWLKEIGHDT